MADAAFSQFLAKITADTDLSLVMDEPLECAATVLREGAASLTVSFCDGLCTARYAGPIAQSFFLTGQAWAGDLQRSVAAAVVLDFTAAAVMFTLDELEAVMSVSRLVKAKRPHALLVQPGQANLFKEYALLSASRGVPQRGFYDRAAAEAWAIEAVARRG